MIKEYFNNKTILITGSTGFLGKVLLERILWEAPEIGKIRLLARPGKSNGSPHEAAKERLEQSLLDSAAFARLRSRHPDFLSFLDEKLEVYACDLFEKDLGLKKKDQTKLFESLDAVIHIAACVNWDERFDYSVRVNTLAGARLMEMAKKATPPPRFVHVSSAFVHGSRSGEVFEEPFDPKKSIANLLGNGKHPFDLDEEIRRALEYADKVHEDADHPSKKPLFEKNARELAGIKKYASESMDQLFQRARNWHIRQELSAYGRERARLHGWFDSYTLSKAMAEMLLTKNHGPVPLSIIRPPGITSAVKDPIQGWLEGYHLVEPLIEGVGRGMIKAFPGDPQTIIDTVPVDYVVNLIMAACALQGEEGAMSVFQIGTSHRKPITLKEISKIWLEYFKRDPLMDKKGKPCKPAPAQFYPDPKKFVNFYQKKRKLPLTMAGKVISSIPIVRSLGPAKKACKWIDGTAKQIDRLCQFSDLYSVYTINTWKFMTHNTLALLDKMPEQDQKDFNVDSSTLDWERYWTETHIPGMRRFVINER
ncbi:SDR family oxidoreductase [Desulfatibacillum aliphaticivorans]|uniref:SDR family oxidoreductase n=1 Tax=Desulfatibacillum aliphaticivorans TaxID=218208 RepID=UPI0004018CA5|nr:SDR family oxidoreductase [Desulfatibacillum aliphaticivorans]